MPRRLSLPYERPHIDRVDPLEFRVHPPQRVHRPTPVEIYVLAQHLFRYAFYIHLKS